MKVIKKHCPSVFEAKNIYLKLKLQLTMTTEILLYQRYAQVIYPLSASLLSLVGGFGGLVVSMLASGNQDRGFAGEKILRMPSFGREVKPFAPCRRFAAC
jgi:hypothetical protein